MNIGPRKLKLLPSSILRTEFSAKAKRHPTKIDPVKGKANQRGMLDFLAFSTSGFEIMRSRVSMERTH